VVMFLVVFATYYNNTSSVDRVVVLAPMNSLS